MEYWLDKLRLGIQAIILFVLAFVSPAQAALEVLLVVATFDFFAGLAGNVWTGNERFRIGKAFGSLYKILAFLILVVVAHYAAYNLGEQEFAWILVKYLTFMVVYWYFINILSNLKNAFPRSQAITFLYLLMSLKILPLLLTRIGLGGDDMAELADQAKRMARSRWDRSPKEKEEEAQDEKN